ncbi:beta strand repeat-containing protein [Algoriphagus aquimarinus]|uniref:beta strand repeat-containing protein n=1 Tax=Algoriphagus aquimarinus TaxID=237018 RepID=UPI00174E4032|nr:hypothetical protein [Algoriphagus aquimarinus]
MPLKNLLPNSLSRFIFLLGLMWFALFSNFLGAQTVTYNSGSANFTVPDGVTTISVSVWGAGGGGGFNSGNKGAAGGGGGAFILANNYTVTPGGTISYTIGTGGIGQSSTSPAPFPVGNGMPSIFGPVGPSQLYANGGSRGSGTTAGTGGAAGAGSYVYRGGGNSATPSNSGNSPGSGGGAAGNSLLAGADGNNLGIGGIGLNGGGSGGAGGTSGTAAQQLGKNGIQPGGGGGGEGADGTSGGNGGDGRIIITWTCSNTLTSTASTASQTVCVGTGITDITYTIKGAYGATFSNLPPGVTGNYVGGLVTISGTPTAAAAGTTYNYTVTPTGSCTSSIATGTIVVSPNNTAGSITSSTFCQGSALPAGVTQATTGATGIGAASNLPPGVTVAWASNQITFSGTPTVFGDYAYTIPLTGGCGTVNATGTITINETPSIKSQNTSGGSTCINGAAFSQMSVGTGFGYTYQWFSNDTPDYTTPNSISGATSNTYTPLNSASGTIYYYVVVSSPTCTSSVTSPVSGAYIVNPTNTVAAASSSPTVCINTALLSAITHTTTGATGIGTIVWSPSNPGGMSTSFSGNTISISGTPATFGVFTYSIPLTGGCGAVNATGTITVNATAAIISPSLGNATQSKCINSTPAFSPISVANRTGFTYQWYSNTTNVNSGGSSIPGANSNSYLPLNNVAGTKYYYVEVSSSGSCGTTATSAISGAFVVNALPVVSFTAQPSSPTCVDTDVTYSTQAGETNYVWTIPGTLGTDYSITSGGNGSPNLVLKWLTPGSKAVTVNYQDLQGCGATSPATSNSITVQKNTATPPSTYPSVCLNGTITPFTHTTTLATGIGAPSGLPAGLTAGFSGNTITISGTITGAVTPGFYNYTIPLTGGCGTVSATGTVEVTPVYTLSTITSVSPSATGGTATVTITGDPTILLNGTYLVTYSMGLANTSGPTTTSVTFTNGKGVFPTTVIGNEDLTSLTISQIKKDTDACFVPITNNNITFFGIRSAVYTSSGTYYVPAGIYQITIKVWGGGGGGSKASNGAGGGGGGYSQVTIPVIPGEPIGMYIGSSGNGETNSPATSGGNSYATRDPAFPSSLAFANGGSAASGGTLGNGGTGQTNNGQNGSSPTVSAGGKGGNGGGSNGGPGGPGGTGSGNNPGGAGTAPGGGGGGSDGNSNGGNGGQGLILISYPLPPVGPCFKVIDDGAISGTTIIEFTCNYTWTAPEGLKEFTVIVGSGGGGGGGGFGSGGGGSGALIKQSFSTTNPYGLPAGTSFQITVGDGGLGATAPNSSGIDGDPSKFLGNIDGNPINISVPGGGGGGSQNSIPGAAGASGGGGGARPNPIGAAGTGGNSIPIIYSGIGATLYQGNPGGNGDYNSNQNAIAGGGGGGLVPWTAADRPNGKAAGAGQGEGGNGAFGVGLNLGDSIRYYGAGGGGIGEYFNGTEKVGIGGSANGVKLGGDGNLASPTATGGTGRNKTGSGGGAGYGAGGKGGKGIVYITYLVNRILQVEYLYFKAEYNQENRSGKLTWATAQEWENDRFEIERATSSDLTSWTKIGEVNGQGYKDSPTSYSFEDTDLPAAGGNIFYRLKQIDVDGSFAYSVTRSIQVKGLKGQSKWIAYPNPSSPGSYVSVDLLDRSSYRDEQILIKISDVKGVFHSYTVRSVEDVSVAVNDYLEQAAPGIHIVQLIWGTNSEQLKIVRR